MGRSLAYFPVVGLALGGFLYGLDQLFELALPAYLVNILLIIALFVITGALHLDGFIDTADGLATGRSPAARLEIMRDSRVGSFGVIGACCLILLLYAALLSLPAGHRMESILLMPVIARWTVVYAVIAYPYARGEQGMGAGFKKEANWFSLAFATAFTLATALVLMQLEGLAVMAGAWLISVLIATYLSRRLGGLTGDTYGAINEVVGIAVLILIPLITWSYNL